ncbi:MAG: hypothetical protein Q7R76_05045 [Candidatus Woesearchaeota archaeon]|nr:hypothetical protein [Candidatus Woesearchaeota archaeon]
MTIRNTLASIVSAAVLALPGCGFDTKDCGQYKFEGIMRSEHGLVEEVYVSFWSQEQEFSRHTHVLTVNSSYYHSIDKYTDENGDFRVDEFSTQTGSLTPTTYRWGEVGAPVLREAQKRFDDYLSKIREMKQHEGLESLR